MSEVMGSKVEDSQEVLVVTVEYFRRLGRLLADTPRQ
jgi:hypothetical protein